MIGAALLGSWIAFVPAAHAQDGPDDALLQEQRDALTAEREEMAAEREALRQEMELLREQVASLQHVTHPDPVERVSFGEEVRVDEGDTVDEVVSFGHDVRVAGRVRGDAVSFGGNVVVAETGQVDGDAVSFGGRVQVVDGGEVTGNRVAMAMPGVGLDLVPIDVDDHHAAGNMSLATDANALLHQLYSRLVLLLSVAGAGVLVVGLFPGRVGRVAQDLEARPVRAAVVGTIATGFVTLFSVLFGVLTLGLGLPVSALLMAILGVAWLLGFVGLCQAVGDRLPLERRPHGRWLAFLVGVVLLTFFGSLPWIGWLVVGAASIIGVGAALSTRFGGGGQEA